MSKTVQIETVDQFESLLRSSKAVLVDFWADWCAPCKAVAPLFEKLSAKYSQPNVITFAKVDHDKQERIVQRYDVSSLPTFILFENTKETSRVKGADSAELQKLVERFAQITQGSSFEGTPLPRGYVDVNSHIDNQGVELLNADGDFGPQTILFSPDPPKTAGKGKAASSEDQPSGSKPDWVQSDTDAQLMLFIPFQSTLKVQSIQITSLASRTAEDDDDDIPARPRRIELYTNRPHNLGFEEAEDIPATQIIELSPTDWNSETGTAVIETRFVKFQNVSSLIMFIVDGDHDAEKTRLDRLRIIGESGEKRQMGKLQKIGDDADG